MANASSGFRADLPARTRRGWLWLVLPGLLAGFSPARAEDGVAGTWRGRYRCGQGETALVLTIRPGARKAGLDALFHFGALPGNSGVPEGCFTMEGDYDGPSRRMSLRAGRWALQPPQYLTVDLEGWLQPGGTRLTGRVLGPLCEGFELRRVSSGPQETAASCRSAAVMASAR